MTKNYHFSVLQDLTLISSMIFFIGYLLHTNVSYKLKLIFCPRHSWNCWNPILTINYPVFSEKWQGNSEERKVTIIYSIAFICSIINICIYHVLWKYFNKFVLVRYLEMVIWITWDIFAIPSRNTWSNFN